MTDDSPIPDDEQSTVYDLLSHSRRRRTVTLLSEHETLSVADVADEIAVAEEDCRLSEVPAETVAQIYLTLHHVHLPKLADAGLVNYDEEQELVAIEDRAAFDWIETAGLIDVQKSTRSPQ